MEQSRDCLVSAGTVVVVIVVVGTESANARWR